MERTNFLPLAILVILLSPLLYALYLFVFPPGVIPLRTWWLGYYIILLAGPFLIGYGMLVYPRKHHRTLARIAFIVGIGLTGVFMWLIVVPTLLSE
ncbi:hypothetical protein [Spirosoma rigui]|uniref:hypothetical protein n=1 Tax=Spirosoma rigui TaxID=564064 RepID=UPI0009B015FE|nr:hypothetical protein [Spirosoma rigui]